jgi:hypothetical protein
LKKNNKIILTDLVIKNFKYPEIVINFIGTNYIPKMWEEPPKIFIELNGINIHNLVKRNKKCRECGFCQKFFDDFGTTTKDWFVDGYGILNLSKFSKNYNDNKSQYTCSYYFTGTKFTFIIYEDEAEYNNKLSVFKRYIKLKRILNE